MAEAPSAPPRTLVRWGVVVVVIAGFAGISMVLGPSEEDLPTLPPELADEPDALLERGTITQYRDDGALNYRLRAELISHFDDAGRSTLQAPVLELHDENRSVWHVASRNGEVRTAPGPSGKLEEQIALTRDVSLAQDRGGGAFTRIRTETLTVFPGRRQAKSEQTAMIETETVSARVAGFEVDLASGRLALFSSADQRVAIVVQPHQQTATLR
ncbi:MAG: LPS export ABC transporter periplasmic protein LptC [Gammaproteobacteria bacterium]|nr:LPS export ABC transporter periplasmic protein LptC [Gammaproteobacteria bacterium]MDE0442299.1 LPS export ABC transporter periplasmic protein LptC [Gammaproteobacteria bacterium]